MSNRFGWLVPALLLGTTLGCGGAGDAHAGADSARVDTTSPAGAPAGSSASGGAAMAPEPADSLAEGDVRIVTTNGGIDLALIGDSISSGLSPQALRTVRAETDTTAVSGTGFGAQIEKMVKGTVQGAVGKRIGFPISDVREVRYDGEKLVFEWTGEPRKLFDNTKIDGKPLLASFAPEDARRFAAAVNARKGRARHL
jgi:hypothetical protein